MHSSLLFGAWLNYNGECVELFACIQHVRSNSVIFTFADDFPRCGQFGMDHICQTQNAVTTLYGLLDTDVCMQR